MMSFVFILTLDTISVS